MTDSMDERQRLEQEIAKLQARLAKLEATDAPPSEAAPADARLAAIRNVRAQNMPLRTWLLATLAEAGVPLYSQYLTSLYICRFDTILPAARLGTLSADERKKIEAGRAPEPALVHGLVAGRGTPIKRIWARSDWPLSERVVAETSGRVLFLKTAIWVFEEAARGDAKWANLDALQLLADQLARDVPIEARANRDYAAWAARAREELARFDDPDGERRTAAADHLSKALNERQRLLGAAEPLVVVPGTHEQAWKDAEA